MVEGGLSHPPLPFSLGAPERLPFEPFLLSCGAALRAAPEPQRHRGDRCTWEERTLVEAMGASKGVSTPKGGEVWMT